MVRLNLQLFAKLNTDTSIVDYLKSQGQDSSYSARKKLAQELGIKNYSGTAQQNTSMLKTLKNQASTKTTNAPKETKTKNDTKASNVSATTTVTPIAGVDQSLVDKANSQFAQSDAVTNAQSEANTYRESYNAIASERDIIDQATWDKLNSTFATSDAYNQAMAYTNQLLEQLSSGRTSYTDQIKDLMGQIQNREDFVYDVSKDTLFQQSLASAMTSGQNAMMDTMGQASALTGGYASTYAQSAGNQAYNSYIQDAYANLPEYYNMAMEAYQMEGQEMYNQLAMLNDADASEYQRMYDSWNANFANTQQMYAQEYGAWQDSINNAYNSANLQLNEHGMAVDNAYNMYQASQNRADTLYAQEYQKWADEVANAMSYMGMQNTDYWNNQTFLEDKRQFDADMEMRKDQFKQEMDYKNNALAQDQAQFTARYDLNGDGKVDAKDQIVSGGSEKSTLTNRELNTAKDVYKKAGGGDKGAEAVDSYLSSIGKENTDFTELDNVLSAIDSELALPYNQSWSIVDDTYNGGFLGLPIFQGEDHNDTFTNGKDTYTYDELKKMIKSYGLSKEEEEAFLKKLSSQSKK